MGWAGKAVRINATDVLVRDARPLHAGLCEGSSDLIGWKPVLISSAMVGQTLAIFTAIEVKSPKGRLTESQRQFIDAINAAGGIAACVRSIDQALGAIRDRDKG